MSDGRQTENPAAGNGFIYMLAIIMIQTRMFERFSRGYYMGRLYVEPSEEGRATLCKRQHERLNEQLYSTGEGVERLDTPLVMKLGSRHLPVHGEEGVPADTLSVPGEWLDERAVRNPPTLTEVLLAKAERATQLVDLANAGR
jgi:hypothetical protein